jgi:hypothetical protein
MVHGMHAVADCFALADQDGVAALGPPPVVVRIAAREFTGTEG